MTRIKVDLDGALAADVGERVMWVFGTMKLPVAWMSYRKTRRGWHVEVEVTRRVHVWRVIAIQAVLGSDYRRETFNLRRTSRWSALPAVARARWNVLFTRKIDITL